jgi:branched-subunit amino acid ABC-type transport system permease component
VLELIVISMLGAFFGFQISRWFGFWPALLIVPLLAGAIGASVERYGLRRVHKNGHVAELLFTFGLAFAIEEIVQIIWGKSPVDFRVPPSPDRSGPFCSWWSWSADLAHCPAPSSRRCGSAWSRHLPSR